MQCYFCATHVLTSYGDGGQGRDEDLGDLRGNIGAYRCEQYASQLEHICQCDQDDTFRPSSCNGFQLYVYHCILYQRTNILVTSGFALLVVYLLVQYRCIGMPCPAVPLNAVSCRAMLCRATLC